jgi:acyl-CoA thioesterase-1
VTRIILQILLLLVALPIAQAQKILIIGDSLSAGYQIEKSASWPALLGEKLSYKYPDWSVVNKSVNGSTAVEGAKKLPKLLQADNYDLVIIALGSNDGLRGYSLVRLRQDLSAMIEECHDSGVKVLLVGAALPLNYGASFRDDFANTFSEVAKKYKVYFIPFLLEGVALQRQYLLADGLHPNAAAQPIIMELVWLSVADIMATHFASLTE